MGIGAQEVQSGGEVRYVILEVGTLLGKGDGDCVRGSCWAKGTLRKVHRPPQARSRYLPLAAAHKLSEYAS